MTQQRRSSSSVSIVTAGLFGFGGILLALQANGALSRALLVFWNSFRIDLGNAIAALVAVGGYMFDHWNSRKNRQREAQMERVNAQSHMLLVPITLQFHSIMLGSILHFVDKHLDDVAGMDGDDDKDSAELDEEFLQSAWALRPTNLKHPRSHRIMMMETMLTQKPITSNDKSDDKRFVHNMVPSINLPRELPPAMHDAIGKVMPKDTGKRKSKLWLDYEQFVRFELNPGIQQIAEIIVQHGDLMEPVPPERLYEIFGRHDNGYGQYWRTMPRMWFYSQWLAYARGWKGVVDAWDRGQYTQMRPHIDFPCGMLFFNIEGQTIVSQVEKELVGMSQMHGHAADPNGNVTVVAHNNEDRGEG